MDATPRIDAGLSNPLARPTLLFALVVLTISAIIGGVLPPMTRWSFAHWYIAGAVLAGYLAVTTRAPGPLAPWRLVVAAGAPTSAALLVLIEPATKTPLLLLGQLCLAASLVILRGHPVVGTLAGGGIYVALTAHYLIHSPGPADSAASVVQPAVAIGGCWALYLIGRFNAENRSRALTSQLLALTKTEAIRTAAAGQRRAMDEISRQVEPLLQRIADGEALAPGLRNEIKTADEDVRNLIRADLPRHPVLVGAVSAARTRGVEVRLIGSEDPESARITDALAERLASLLTVPGLRRATARFRPSSRGGGASLLLEGEHGVRRHEFDAQGRPIRSV